MKKTLVVLALTLAVFLTSCSPQTPNNEGQLLSYNQTKTLTETYNQPFKTTANITYNDINVKANIEKTSNGNTTVTFESPETLSSLSFEVSADDVKVNYLGMTFHIDPNNLDSSMLVSTIVSTFNSVANQKGISAKVKDNTVSIEGENSGAKFEMVLDRENKNALSLDIPSIGLSAKFE